MKCWKTGKLSARNKKHIYVLKGHSSLLQIHANINSSRVNSFPLPALQALLLAVTSSQCKNISNRSRKSEAGRPTVRVWPQLQMDQQPM